MVFKLIHLNLIHVHRLLIFQILYEKTNKRIKCWWSQTILVNYFGYLPHWFDSRYVKVELICRPTVMTSQAVVCFTHTHPPLIYGRISSVPPSSLFDISPTRNPLVNIIYKLLQTSSIRLVHQSLSLPSSCRQNLNYG